MLHIVTFMYLRSRKDVRQKLRNQKNHADKWRSLEIIIISVYFNITLHTVCYHGNCTVYDFQK